LSVPPAASPHVSDLINFLARNLRFCMPLVFNELAHPLHHLDLGRVFSRFESFYRFCVDRDNQVELGEGGKQIERDEKEPGKWRCFHGGAGDAHGPDPWRHNLESGVLRPFTRAESIRKICVELVRRYHGKDMNQRATAPRCSCSASEASAQHRDMSAGGNPGDSHRGEVEQAPGVTE
jgi:hypothetical protein